MVFVHYVLYQETMDTSADKYKCALLDPSTNMLDVQAPDGTFM